MNVNHLIAYITRRSRPSSSLRLAMVLYLCDWERVQSTGKKFTNLKWKGTYYDTYLPIIKKLYRSKDLTVLLPVESKLIVNFSEQDEKIIKKILWEAQELSVEELTDVVYDTLPMKSLIMEEVLYDLEDFKIKA